MIRVAQSGIFVALRGTSIILSNCVGDKQAGRLSARLLVLAIVINVPKLFSVCYVSGDKSSGLSAKA